MISWGTFAPDQVGQTRRPQTLELAAAVRHYNERSVLGLGGLWFGMPVAWSLLGMSLFEEYQVRHYQLQMQPKRASCLSNLLRSRVGNRETSGKQANIGPCWI